MSLKLLNGTWHYVNDMFHSILPGDPVTVTLDAPGPNDPPDDMLDADRSFRFDAGAIVVVNNQPVTNLEELRDLLQPGGRLSARLKTDNKKLILANGIKLATSFHMPPDPGD